MYSRSSRSPAVTKSSTLYYPIYLSYATGVLEEAGFEVKLVDAVAMDYGREDVLKIIKEFKPALTVVDTSTPSICNDIEVAGAIKDAVDTFIVMVGTHVSALPDEVLESSRKIDAIARHEYDYTILDLARSMEGAKLKKVPGYGFLKIISGLSFRSGDAICHNSDREYIENLDAIPFVSKVYKKYLSDCMDKYFYGANLHPVVAILSGRGCPHQCIYCVYPQTMTGNRYRLRSITNLVDELEFIKRELPAVREVFLEDDTLTVNRQRAQGIAREIIKRGLKITWSTNSRADVDLETMKIMHKAGCRELCVGFESASQQILDKLGKGIQWDSYLKFRKNAARAGLIIHGCFMYGNEGETYESMRKTLELAKRLNCDSAQFYPIMVYPGTKAYQSYRERDYILAKNYSDWLTEDGLHNCVVSIPGISNEDLVAFCDLSRREFYLRPAYIFSKMIQIILNPKEAKRIFRASGTLLKHIFCSSLKKNGRAVRKKEF
jgi:radical SAM superfamily enzyme YgiQ (UPF0313 family)